MAKNVKVVMNVKGVGELLTSPGVTADLERRGAAVKAAMGEPGEIITGVSPGSGNVAQRTNVRVTYAGTMDPVHAMRHEAKHGTLARALAAGGGQ